MDEPYIPHPRVLVVEDDQDLLELLQLLLADSGYEALNASSLSEALALLDTSAFHLILTDSFARTLHEVLPSLQFLRQRAHPTPVGLVTGWGSEEDVERAGFAFLIPKPFDADRLLFQVAATLHTPLHPDQERQAQVVHLYFAALTVRKWDKVIELCTNDVVYVLPGEMPFSGEVTGKAAFRAYTEETFAHFPSARFAEVMVYASPSGLAARYKGSWLGTDNCALHMTGAVHFQFEGVYIKQIGVQLNDERLRTLMAAQSETAPRPGPLSAATEAANMPGHDQ
jgi:CheY-like chemotaxis protein